MGTKSPLLRKITEKTNNKNHRKNEKINYSKFSNIRMTFIWPYLSSQTRFRIQGVYPERDIHSRMSSKTLLRLCNRSIFLGKISDLARRALLITDPTSTSSNKLSSPQTKKILCDMWYVIHYMWHVAPDLQHVTHGVGWTFSKNLSSLAFTVCV